ncbi:MAG: hypothetical protein Aurels2KO_31380 [Aureliella sp.]
MPRIFLLALAAIVLYVLWEACRTKWQITIVYEPDLGTTTRGVPQAKSTKVQDFFDEDIRSPERIKVLASRIPPNRLTTKFIGNIDPGTKQRIRNFLIETL